MTTNKPLIKRFDIEVTAEGQSISKGFELDKNVVAVNGVLVTSDKDDLLYYRGTQSIEINKVECFPDNYESKLLMSGINVGPKQRYYELTGVVPGNGAVKIVYRDNEDGRTTFEPYRVSVYFECETQDEI